MRQLGDGPAAGRADHGKVTRRLAAAMLTGLCLLAAAAAPAGALPAAAHAAPKLPAPAACHGCWLPGVRPTWQWQLSGAVRTSVRAQMYDIDMFEATPALVRRLHTQKRHVVCYIDAGSWERWRPDAGRFPRSVIGRAMQGWPGERWLDIRRLGVLGPLLERRIERCAAKGFDGVEFDNVDGYQAPTGFRLTAADQLRFNVWLANHAHRAGLAVALKNDPDQVRTLQPYFDMELDEQCFQYSECRLLLPFIRHEKPVFEVEYGRLARSGAFCGRANGLGFESLRKHLALGPWRIPCR
jgi:hypothetical protein